MDVLSHSYCKTVSLFDFGSFTVRLLELWTTRQTVRLSDLCEDVEPLAECCHISLPDLQHNTNLLCNEVEPPQNTDKTPTNTNITTKYYKYTQNTNISGPLHNCSLKSNTAVKYSASSDLQFLRNVSYSVFDTEAHVIAVKVGG